MSEADFMRECELCDSQFRYGPHIYDGTFIRQ